MAKKKVSSLRRKEFRVARTTDIDKLSHAIYLSLLNEVDEFRFDVVVLVAMGNDALLRAVKAVATATTLAKRNDYSLISDISYTSVSAIDDVGEEVVMSAIEITVSYG